MIEYTGKLIEEIQETIARQDEAGHYAKTYRFHECENWGAIPSWIFYDHAMSAGPRILDVGAAYGTLSAFCRESLKANVFALDRVDYFLKPSVQGKYGLAFFKADIERAPIPWKFEFHAALLTEVLEHFNFNPLPTLKKIRASLIKGGMLYLSTPLRTTGQRGKGKYEHWTEIPEFSIEEDPPHVDGHIHEYRREELVGLLDRAGFLIVNLDETVAEGRHRIQVAARTIL
ncbi:MAG: class I SAM-dependent methyltransferase [Planctomycetota bacterium]|jgi:SAM-dependent methyltransferase